MDEGTKSGMTADRVRALERLGFEWAKRKGDVAWNSMYEDLCAYREKHGHADVPTKYDENKTLGRWVSTQRSQYKLFKTGMRSLMTQERYEKLCLLNFKFDMMNTGREDEEDEDEKEEGDEEEEEEQQQEESSEETGR